jgi:HD-GYP domain-containing protein (c-di-GMP phosphodiesterase class II)
VTDTFENLANQPDVQAAALRTRRIGPASEPLIDASEKILLLMEDRLPGGIGHARLVAEAMAAIGVEVGFSPDHVEALTCAGLLHDIGCAYWPAQLLTKPGRWNSDDIQRAQQHPVSGSRIVHEIEALRPTGPWILEHHERLDGRGYP